MFLQEHSPNDLLDKICGALHKKMKKCSCRNITSRISCGKSKACRGSASIRLVYGARGDACHSEMFLQEHLCGFWIWDRASWGATGTVGCRRRSGRELDEMFLQEH